MKKPAAKRPARGARPAPDDILPQYDFRAGRRNPYASRLAGGQIVVVDADLVELFPDSAAVNAALRVLAGLSPRTRRPAARKHRTTR